MYLESLMGEKVASVMVNLMGDFSYDINGAMRIFLRIGNGRSKIFKAAGRKTYFSSS